MIRPKIGIFGRVNAGKSTLMNLIMGTPAAIVSDQAGTTTDPVRRLFEIIDFAPVVLIDTAGFDDRSELGPQRVAKSMAVLSEVDLAVMVIEGVEPDESEIEFMRHVTSPSIVVSRRLVWDRNLIIERIKQAIPLSTLVEPPFFGDRISQGDIIFMVCPIDSEAPSGRLILPQVQALRAALDGRAVAVVMQTGELSAMLQLLVPKLIVIDSQVFHEVAPLIPASVELTSFSILLSELKGDPDSYRNGLVALNTLRDDHKVLLIEHCSHQTSCDDIARVKIPALLKKKLGVSPKIEVSRTVESTLGVHLIVQCGGCMTNRHAVISNVERARRDGIHITNYGMLLRKLSEV